jgi:hypothetical protein
MVTCGWDWGHSQGARASSRPFLILLLVVDALAYLLFTRCFFGGGVLAGYLVAEGSEALSLGAEF